MTNDVSIAMNTVATVAKLTIGQMCPWMKEFRATCLEFQGHGTRESFLSKLHAWKVAFESQLSRVRLHVCESFTLLSVNTNTLVNYTSISIRNY